MWEREERETDRQGDTGQERIWDSVKLLIIGTGETETTKTKATAPVSLNWTLKKIEVRKVCLWALVQEILKLTLFHTSQIIQWSELS